MSFISVDQSGQPPVISSAESLPSSLPRQFKKKKTRAFAVLPSACKVELGKRAWSAPYPHSEASGTKTKNELQLLFDISMRL